MIVPYGAEELELLAMSSEFNGFGLSTRIMPAHRATRGGDWCETFALSAHVVALSIGDVCGHGPDAFEAMVTTRQVVRDEAARGLDPGRTLASVNRVLCHAQPEAFVTAIFALLDTKRFTLTFANAGHPPPLMAGCFGEHFVEFGVGDLLLGVDEAAVPIVHTLNLPAEALLVFYTDGVIERQRNAVLGRRQLLSAATFAHHCSGLSAASIIERQMFLMGSNLDDAAILTARAPALRMQGAR